MFRISDLRHKDVVNNIDGKRLGYIKDVELDLNEGKIRAIILPGENKMFSLFGRNEDIVVDWQQVKKIGVDVILVELPGFTAPASKEEKEAEELYESAYRKREKRRRKAVRVHDEEEDYTPRSSFRPPAAFPEPEMKAYPPPKRPEPEYYASYPPPEPRAEKQSPAPLQEPPPAPAPAPAKAPPVWSETPLWHKPPAPPESQEAPAMQQTERQAPYPASVKHRTPASITWGEEALRQGKDKELAPWGDKSWEEAQDWGAPTDWQEPPPDWLQGENKSKK